ncbi:MAG TPA: hypothetical protein PLP21_17970 [Pyrinomonadaceae bacterium]|nr:hypothetical protein [Acidobacteriota bacterium]HQZ98212.1 hypothetical protein [Pyrinomonadaceae bacterium]
MKRIALLLAFVSLFSLSLFAQADSQETARVKKDLKQNLLKNTRNVYAVDYSGCEASIKITTTDFQPTLSGSAGPAFGYGGFPTSDYGFGSGSSGNDPGRLTSFRYLIDLSKLDGANIAVTNGWLKGTSVISIEGGVMAGSIRKMKDGKIETINGARFDIKTKSADRAVDSLRSMIRSCSGIK